MEMLNQIDPKLHHEVRRRQAELWDSCIHALASILELAFQKIRSVELSISVEEVAADLAYGRD
jgi:hypothetical protein